MNARKKGWVFVIIQFLLIALVVVLSFYERKLTGRSHNYITDSLAFLFLSAGALLFIISIINFGQFVTPNPVPQDDYKLRTNGLYSKVRHPIYLSVIILITGYLLFFSAFYTFLIFPLIVLFLHFKMNFEEENLEKKFPEYALYKTHTKRLLPGLY